MQGELTLVGNTCPIAFDVTVGAGDRLSGSAVVKQTDWGITPYSTLFGSAEGRRRGRGRARRRPRRSRSRRRRRSARCVATPEVEPRPMHLRAPSIDPGVTSFLWALIFFLFLWFGMLAVGVSEGTALLFALVAAFLIFVFVRTQGAGRER